VDIDIFARLDDIVRWVKKNHAQKNTIFMDPYQAKKAENILKYEDSLAYRFYGGYEGAERRMLVVFPEYFTDNDIDMPIAAIDITWKSDDAGITHRDCMGAILGLGISREKLGDILVFDGGCQVVMAADIQPYVLLNLNKIGKTTVSVQGLDISRLKQPDLRFREINTTLASLRLDSAIAAAFGLSRANALEAIRAGKVALNWEPCDKPDKTVSEGDVLSMRGYGRADVQAIVGQTRKGRIAVSIRRFL